MEDGRFVNSQGPLALSNVHQMFRSQQFWGRSVCCGTGNEHKAIDLWQDGMEC